MMKTIRILFTSAICCSIAFYASAQTCSPTGNVALYSNYDGGYLNIDVNQNIPNLKIGIAAYEPTIVSITGAFAGNVTEVIYAGYYVTGPGNDHCSGVNLTSVNAPASAALIMFEYPPVTLISPLVDFFGFMIPAGDNNGILGCVSCDNNTYQGGGNTAAQIIDYFMTAFAGNEFRFLKTQYECWCGTQNMDVPATCCFEIPINPPAVAISTIPTDGFCSADVVTLFAGEGYDSYDWSNGGTASTTSINAPGTYSVTVTSGCGTATASITVSDCNTDFSVSLDDQDICLNDEAILTANITGGSPPYFITWSEPTVGNPVAITVSPPFTTTYTVTVTDSDGNTVTASAIIFVFDCGSDIQLNVIGSAICLNQTGTVTVEVFGGTAPFTYSWNPNAGNTNTITVSPAVTSEYTVTVTDAVGNQATASGFVVVLPNALPIIDLGDDFPLCEPSAVLNALNPEVFDYLWSTGANTPQITITLPGTYSVEATSFCGPAFAEITVLPCQQELAVQLSGASVCPGQTVVLQPIVTGGVAPYQYLWQPGGSTGETLSVTATANATYTLIVTDAAGNQASASADIIVFNADLTVALPQGLQLCEPSVVLNAQAPNAQSYLWNTGLTTPSITVTEPGVYSVTLTGVCGTFTTQTEVLECGTLNVQLLGQTICKGDEATLLAVVTGGEAPFQFVWNPPLGNGPGPYTVSPAASQVYTVIVMDASGEMVTQQAAVNVLSVSIEIDWEEEVSICPGESVLLDAFIPDAQQYLWSTGATAASINAFTPGAYTVQVSGECIDLNLTANLAYPEKALLPPYAKKVRACEEDGAAVIGPDSTFGYLLRWNNGPLAFNLEVESSGTYTAIYEGPCGPKPLSVEVLVEICDCQVYLPNAFSPNADGINDLFRPVSACTAREYEFYVFNRWGQVVFQTNNEKEGWNGSSTESTHYGQNDVYFWKVRFVPDTEVRVSEAIERTGFVMVIR